MKFADSYQDNEGNPFDIFVCEHCGEKEIQPAGQEDPKCWCEYHTPTEEEMA